MDEEPKGVKVDRSDRATRLLIDGQNELADKVRSLDVQLAASEDARKKELEHFVSYKALWAFLGAILALGFWFHSRIKEMTDAIEKTNTDARRDQADKLEAFRKDVEWIRSRVDGSADLKASQQKRKKE